MQNSGISRLLPRLSQVLKPSAKCIQVCWALMLAGCVHYAKDIRLVAIAEDAHPGRSLGNVTGEDCGVTIFSFGKSLNSLTGNAAMTKIQSDKGIRYFNGVSITKTSTSVFAYQRNCLVVSAEAFK